MGCYPTAGFYELNSVPTVAPRADFDQSDLANDAPFRRVWHHEGSPSAGTDPVRRKDARPAINEAAAECLCF